MISDIGRRPMTKWPPVLSQPRFNRSELQILAFVSLCFEYEGPSTTRTQKHLRAEDRPYQSHLCAS